MGNDALRRAMDNAKITNSQLASACEVDVKTVARWTDDEGRFPHPRHRWRAADVLGVDEILLWPEAAKARVKTGADREVSRVWPVRSEMPNSTWSDLFRRATEDICLAGWTCYFLWLETHQLGELLRAKGQAGCRVRFLIGDPDDPATAEREAIEDTPLTLRVRIQVTLAELEKLRGVAGIEARYADRRLMGMSVFRFDNKAIVTPHLASTTGKDAPTLLLERHQKDGLFDRMARMHVDELWDAGHSLW